MNDGVDRVGCVVVGAGVVGLAIARALAIGGHDVLILEAESAIGTATSSRNSEVIHAGLYYPPDSLRARFCVAGRHAMYAYCQTRGVAARACGKLVVAADTAELAQLDAILDRGRGNGVEGLALLTRTQALALEPALACAGALHSAMTGIVDSHGLMVSLRGEAEDHGAVFAFRAPVLGATVERGGFSLRVGGAEPTRLHCRALINAAGLGACQLAGRIEGLAPLHVPPAYLAKGSYFSLRGRSPFRHLIYPVPIPGGAGIHLTLDQAGAARFGPDVEPVAAIGYDVDPARADLFARAIRRYWPGLPDGALQPAYAGIRPKIVPPTQAQDFVIQGPGVHGVPGLINLFGIESPGLTACLAIASAVSRLVE